jgi:hypothetical protein
MVNIGLRAQYLECHPILDLIRSPGWEEKNNNYFELFALPFLLRPSQSSELIASVMVLGIEIETSKDSEV